MDKINPDHYLVGGIETIDYIQAKLTGQQFMGYLVGNVIKYLSRFEYKAGEEDLQKARWYLNRLLVQRKRPIIYVCSPLRGDVERNIHFFFQSDFYLSLPQYKHRLPADIADTLRRVKLPNG
jgi:hypothetical protein